ncbi:hypothetical protein MnTg01_00951 [archaeon MnTg01]|jgi:hypothetical protein|nr:hypothetical protein MnTg01_00951 [archaeon MnTg01]
MTRFVLDKNPKKNLTDFKEFLELNTLNLIMHSDPFLKTNFIIKIISTTNNPVIFLDFDLLFSGYISSHIIPQSQNLTLYQPTRKNWLEIIKTILLNLSERKSILIIDSLNGLFNMYSDKKNAGRLVNSFVMLFSSIAKMSDSHVLISGMTRKKNGEDWVLSIIGRHVFRTKKMNAIYLEKINSSFIANFLDEKTHPIKSFKIPIQSELI